MIQRLYIHNFRCFQNFELRLSDTKSALLVGKNGVGKSTIRKVLEIFRDVASGKNRVADLVRIDDFAFGDSDRPIRFELEALIGGKLFRYALALELPLGWTELRVTEESLQYGEESLINRNLAQVEITKSREPKAAQFRVDWHFAALPIIQENSPTDPLGEFKRWLGRILIFAPYPAIMDGESIGSTLVPTMDLANMGMWFTGILSESPAQYQTISQFITLFMPDFFDAQNPQSGQSRSMSIQFKRDGKTFRTMFGRLSDGEKCLFVGALAVAYTHMYPDVLCFWDEPDNYLSLSEVGQFIRSLRKSFERSGQLLVTSHHSETVRRFSDVNTFILDRASLLEPVIVRRLEDLHYEGDLIESLLSGAIMDPSTS